MRRKSEVWEFGEKFGWRKKKRSEKKSENVSKKQEKVVLEWEEKRGGEREGWREGGRRGGTRSLGSGDAQDAADCPGWFSAAWRWKEASPAAWRSEPDSSDRTEQLFDKTNQGDPQQPMSSPRAQSRGSEPTCASFERMKR